MMSFKENHNREVCEARRRLKKAKDVSRLEDDVKRYLNYEV